MNVWNPLESRCWHRDGGVTFPEVLEQGIVKSDVSDEASGSNLNRSPLCRNFVSVVVYLTHALVQTHQSSDILSDRALEYQRNSSYGYRNDKHADAE